LNSGYFSISWLEFW